MRSLTAAIMTLFFLILSVSYSYAKPSVGIDSLSGVVELQRAGTVNWTYATKLTRLYNNDLIRLPDTGIAILLWPDGTRTYLHKKSQILITLLQKKNSTGIMSNVTVMFGTAFFVVKKMLPQEKSDEMKVYTPTAVLSIRGTSFLVDVDSVEKKTTVKMVNGMLLVKNISKNISILLGTPFQTEIAQTRNPSTPRPVLKKDLDSIKIWVPEPVIETEIVQQIDNTTQPAAEPAGELRNRCLVTLLVNKSGYSGPWNIEQEISRYFSTLLRRTLSNTVVMITDSVVDNPVETARTLDAQFCISGTIDIFNLTKRAEITARADEYKESVIARAAISVSLFDIPHNKNIVSDTFSSEMTGKNTYENSWNSFHRTAFNLSDTTFTKSIIGSVSKNAVSQSVYMLAKHINE